ncbi:MAG: hypothetical protein RLY14_2456 [Planctomycetota bacterium]
MDGKTTYLTSCYQALFPLATGFLVLASVSIVPGCNRGPKRVEPITLSGAQIATEALKQFDKDTNGELSQQELANLPSVLSVLTQYDKDSNGSLNAAEIEERITRWQQLRVGLVNCSFTITLDGKALQKADVELLPETICGGTLPRCIGKTDEMGRVTLSTVADDPNAQNTQGLPGIPPGLYKVVVVHPKTSNLAKYNSQTVLGIQVAPDDPELMRLNIALSSSK